MIDAITKIAYIRRSDESEIWSTRSDWFPRLVASVYNSAARRGSQQAGCRHFNYDKNFCCRFAVFAAMLDWQDNFSGRIRGAGRLLPPLLPLEHSALGELGIEME